MLGKTATIIFIDRKNGIPFILKLMIFIAF